MQQNIRHCFNTMAKKEAEKNLFPDKLNLMKSNYLSTTNVMSPTSTISDLWHLKKKRANLQYTVSFDKKKKQKLFQLFFR